MDQKMKNRIEALSRITTKNGATSNEEEIAKRKIKLYRDLEDRKMMFKAAMELREHRTKNPTEVEIFDDWKEVQQRDEFEKLKEQNRKKWGVNGHS